MSETETSTPPDRASILTGRIIVVAGVSLLAWNVIIVIAWGLDPWYLRIALTLADIALIFGGWAVGQAARIRAAHMAEVKQVEKRTGEMISKWIGHQQAGREELSHDGYIARSREDVALRENGGTSGGPVDG